MHWRVRDAVQMIDTSIVRGGACVTWVSWSWRPPHHAATSECAARTITRTPSVRSRGATDLQSAQMLALLTEPSA
jgi:hypothetical protein